jgi:hypothetical protein
MAMDAEIKAQWVAALREPERKQGLGKLRSAYGGQCCLDVLAELAANAGVLPQPVLEEWEDFDDPESTPDHPVMTQAEEYSYQWVDAAGGDHYETELLPNPVMKWAELDYSNPEVDYQGTPTYLSELNDVIGLSLAEIADLIEQDSSL